MIVSVEICFVNAFDDLCMKLWADHRALQAIGMPLEVG